MQTHLDIVVRRPRAQPLLVVGHGQRSNAVLVAAERLDAVECFERPHADRVIVGRAEENILAVALLHHHQCIHNVRLRGTPSRH